jgi:hypothetical protein
MCKNQCWLVFYFYVEPSNPIFKNRLKLFQFWFHTQMKKRIQVWRCCLKKKVLVLVWTTFLLQENFSQFPNLKLKLLHVLEKKMVFKILFCPIMNLIVKISHRRLSKAHTCFHHMAPISKLDMLDCSTIGFRVCLFGQSPLLHLPNPQHWLGRISINFANLYALFTPSLYVLWQAIAIKF